MRSLIALAFVLAFGGTTALAALAAGTAAPAATPVFKASLKVSTTRPKVEAPMRYTVRVTDAAGKPMAVRLTMRIRDPFGGVHPVEFDSRKVFITNHRFVGTFVDQVEWPQSAVGFALTFQAVVRAKGVTRTLSVKVTTVT